MITPVISQATPITKNAPSKIIDQLALTVKKIALYIKELFKGFFFLFTPVDTSGLLKQKVITKEELESFLLPACLTAGTCNHDEKNWTEPFNAVPVDLSSYTDNLPSGFSYNTSKSILVHEGYGIIVKVYETENSRFVCFGSKAAISHADIPNSFEKEQRIIRMAITNMVGVSSAHYSPVAEICDFFKNHTPLLQEDKKLKFIGHSFGGSLAQIAGIYTEKKALAFAPFHLGIKTQYKLGLEKLALAQKNIQIVYTENDGLNSSSLNWYIKIVNTLGLRTFANIGQKIKMPSAYKSPTESHSYLLGSFMKALDYDIRTKPSAITPLKPEFLVNN